MILPSWRCSMMCAAQPAVRAMTKMRREEFDGNAHEVIGHGRVPVEIGEHALGVAHGALDALGDGVEALSLGVHGQRRAPVS